MTMRGLVKYHGLKPQLSLVIQPYYFSDPYISITLCALCRELIALFATSKYLVLWGAKSISCVWCVLRCKVTSLPDCNLKVYKCGTQWKTRNSWGNISLLWRRIGKKWNSLKVISHPPFKSTHMKTLKPLIGIDEFQQPMMCLQKVAPPKKQLSLGKL